MKKNINQHHLLTVRKATIRARDEGFAISEHSLRLWIRTGELPVRWAGNRALIYYPALLDFLCLRG